MYFVYILECKDGSLYTGIATDVARRFAEHQQGIGSHYTRARKAKKIVYTEECANRSVASKREAEVKKMSRAQKLMLVKSAIVGKKAVWQKNKKI
ncbi:MAG: GIY-YIG nuclease family protein [Candidatus Adlerbacteria bacterium]